MFLNSKSYHFLLFFDFFLQFLVLVNPSYHQYIKKDKGRYSCSLCSILLLNQHVAEIHIKQYHLAKRAVFDKYIIPSCNCEEGKSVNLSRNRWHYFAVSFNICKSLSKNTVFSPINTPAVY